MVRIGALLTENGRESSVIETNQAASRLGDGVDLTSDASRNPGVVQLVDQRLPSNDVIVSNANYLAHTPCV